jgi:hypothetical protein
MTSPRHHHAHGKIIFVFDTARQLYFTRSLEHFSAKLGELLERACLHHSPLPPELLDEIAFMTGELMIMLTNHSSEDASIQEVLSYARSLREYLRVNKSQDHQITEECDSFSREVTQLLINSKKAA